MRERLVAGFVGLTVLTLVVFGVSRAFALTSLVEEYELGEARRSTTLIASLLGERQRNDEPITAQVLRGLIEEDEHLSYVVSPTEVIESGPVSDVLAAEDEDRIRVARTVTGGGTVTLTRSGDVVNESVANQLAPLVLLGILLAALSAVLGLLLARRLARPFADLTRVAGEFGRGRFDVEVPHYPVPEAEDIGNAMRGAGREVRGLVRRERQFAANASHQLRTPITALRLDLEDLAMWGETTPMIAKELSRALRELDRLTEAVTSLLELSRGHRLSPTEFDLAALVADTTKRWGERVRSEGRKLSFESSVTKVPARLAPGPIGQILDVLIDNAVRHGSGTVKVVVDLPDSYVRVQVSDEGAKVIDSEVFLRSSTTVGSDGEGIGLAVAKEMAEAIGGRLSLEPADETTFTLILPKSDDESLAAVKA